MDKRNHIRPDTSSTQAQTNTDFHQNSLINSSIRGTSGVRGQCNDQEKLKKEQNQQNTVPKKQTKTISQQKQKQSTRYKDVSDDNLQEIEQIENNILASDFQNGQPLLQRSDSPTIIKVRNPQQHHSQKPIQIDLPNYKLISLNEIIENYRLNQPHQKVTNSRNPKCSCFRITTQSQDYYKQNLINKGQDQFMAEEKDQRFSIQYKEQRNIIYSINYYITSQEKFTELQYLNMTKDMVNYFQIFQFLSCVEYFQQNLEAIINKLQFDQFIYFMTKIALHVFNLLKNNKLDSLWKQYRQDQTISLLRNFHMGILHHIINFEIIDQDTNSNVDVILNNYSKRTDQIYFLNYFLQQVNQNN